MFLHWLNLDALVIFLLILSRIIFRTLPILDLVGLVSRQVGLWAKLGLWSLSVMNDTVPLEYMLTAKTNLHTLRRTVVRRTYTIALRARSKKMRNSCAFVIQCYKYPLYYSCVKQRTFRFENATSLQRKIYLMKKAIITDACSITSRIY